MSWIEQIRARNARAMLSPLGNAYATHDEYEREISELLKAFDDAKTVGHAVMSNRDYFRKRVRALEGEVANLKAERERYEHATEELTYIIQKAAHRRCDYCILRTEPCPERGLNAECGFEYAGAEESENEQD